LKKLSAQRERSVFLNLPFEKKYESIFVGLIVGLVTVGLIPRSVVELHENGDGRMARLFQLMEECAISIHDLSYSGAELPYNMPFELGIAYALSARYPNSILLVFEAKKRDLLNILTDLRGFDPKLHHMRGEEVFQVIYSTFVSPDRADPEAVGLPIYRHLIKNLSEFRKGQKLIFNKRSFSLLVHSTKAWSNQLGKRD
jgi:hypothetical protein